MTLDELARMARVTIEQLQEWIDLELIPSASDHGSEALERARLLRLATLRGLAAADIAAASQREGDLLGRYVSFSGVAAEEPVSGLDDIAERVGLDATFVRRLRRAAALDEAELDEGDVAMLRAVRMALDAGMPEAALLQLVRVYGDSLGRITDAEARLFHFYVHDQLRAGGASPEDVAAMTGSATETLVDLLEPAVLYFHRRGMVRAMREDVLMHLAEDVAPVGPVGQLSIAVLFVDLAGFTPMTEAMGDEAAADVVDRFSELIRDEAVHCDGRVVKQIGDEFMLVFPNAASAVRYALHLADTAAGEHSFPALRMGAHLGPALYREADYLGTTVNTAARVAGQAEGGQLVITRAVRDDLDNDAIIWVELGARHLKGLAEPLELFATTTVAGDPRRVDPICGMLITANQSTYASAHNPDVYFCSEVCRDRHDGVDEEKRKR